MRFSPLFCSLLLAFAVPAQAAEPGGSKVSYTLKESTLNGKQFYPIGIYAVEMNDFARVRDYGFNLVQSYGFGMWTDEKVKQYLDTAHQHGLRVFFQLPHGRYGAITSEQNVALIKRRVDMFKHHPALFSWYLADEPSVKREAPKDMAAIYRWIKAADPHHPVMTSNWELPNYLDSTDMDMRQIYGGPPERIARAEEGYWKFVKKAGKDWVAILNTHDSGWGQRRMVPAVGLAAAEQAAIKPKEIVELSDLPPEDERTLNASDLKNVRPGSPAEAALKERDRKIAENLAKPPYPASFAFPDSQVKFRGAAFDMVAHGSNGLFYWLWQPEDRMIPRWGWYTVFVRPDLRQMVKDTLHELSALSDRIVAPSVDSETFRAGAQGEVLVWCRRQGGRFTVIAVNESGTQQTVNISLPWKDAPGVMAVNAEGRRLTVSGGKLQDRFAPNEAHVYIEEAVPAVAAH